jgi:hypothetical protein
LSSLAGAEETCVPLHRRFSGKQLFEYLYGTADAQQRFAQVRTLLLHLLKFRFACLELLLQHLEPGLHLIAHDPLLSHSQR